MENSSLKLQRLENRTKKLERWLCVSIGGWLLAFGLAVLSSGIWESHAQQTTAPASLRVTELVVVDSKGIERSYRRRAS